MSLPSDYATDEWFRLPDIAHPTTKSHAHPLRSHSAEDLNCTSRTAGGDATEALRPDSGIFADPYHPGGFHNTYRSYRDTEPLPSPPLPTHQPFRVAPAERFSDSSAHQQYVVIPTRPPLRPTISFGGETRVSYYSISTDATSDLDKRSRALVAEEELQYQRNEASTAEKQTWRFYVSFVLLCLLRLGCGMGTTALSTALPAVALDLHADAVKIVWVANSFLLASAASQPAFMRLSYALGARLLVTLGIVLGAGGSLACAAASNLTILLLGRTLAGCGSGAVGVLTLLALQHLATPKDLRKCVVGSDLAYWLGAAAGPIICGVATQSLGWHYIFWVTGAIGVVAVMTLPFLLPLKSDDGADWQELRKIDYTGYILLTGAIVLFTMALSWGGSSYRWASWQTLVPLTLGLVALAVFTQFCRYTVNPILPVSILRQASALASCFGTLVHGIVLTIIVYMAPIWFQIADGSSEVRSGLLLSSWVLALVVAYAVTAAVLGVIGYRISIWVGWLLVTLGCGLVIALKPSTPTTTSIPIGMLTGFGLGMLVPALSAAVESAASTDDETIHAGPLQRFFSTLGQALGVTISSCVFLNRFGSAIAHSHSINVDATAYQHDALSLISVVRDESSLGTATRLVLANSYFAAFRWIWVTICIVAALALVAALWFTEDVKPVRRTRRASAGFPRPFT